MTDFNAGQSVSRYKTLAALVVAWCLLLPCLVWADTFLGRVVGILDGDTLRVMHDGTAVKVRLYGIDAPEKKQAFGTQARQFTSDLVFKQTVLVLSHGSDRYGRLLGDVWLADGHTLSQVLVRAGMAWWYRQYAQDDTTLAALEAEARVARRGLWVDAVPVPPWEWRKERRVLAPGAK